MAPSMTHKRNVSAGSDLDTELARYLSFLQTDSAGQSTPTDDEKRLQALLMAPLLSFQSRKDASSQLKLDRERFPHYAIMGEVVDDQTNDEARLVLLNTGTPWPAFICGSQGSGKSYTLSRMLENCLLPDPRISTVITPLAGIAFNWSRQHGTICEAAYLCTAGIKVNVLVSPSSLQTMNELYTTMLNDNENLQVSPFSLRSSRLNNERMMKLMSFDSGSDSPPLYMQVIQKLLRQMAMESQGPKSFDYSRFKKKLDDEKLDPFQRRGLDQRIGLLDSFVDSRKHKSSDPLLGEAGMLTIVDLTCPFIDSESVCMLFDVALSVFMELTEGSKVVALDEAHNYMNDGIGSSNFTQRLLQLIREQRHKGVRTIIATQEPTVSPKLLELCSMTFVHRFQSPAWLDILERHVAGAKCGPDEPKDARLIEILRLNVGESLLFSSSAILGWKDGKGEMLEFRRIKLKTRPRISEDGGRSVLAK